MIVPLVRPNHPKITQRGAFVSKEGKGLEDKSLNK